jgi:hypothetical protein
VKQASKVSGAISMKTRRITGDYIWDT